MKTLILGLVIFLSGCSILVPVKRKFPDAPEALKTQCEALRTVDVKDKVAITELLKVVVQNYTLYYECSSKVEGWNEWYESQKKIFDNVK
jgi:hypothetical protein